jgi:replicative DNA helicase
MEERNFGHLGFSFQQSLIKAIIEDKKFGETIIDVLETKFFDNNSFRYIIENIKELHTKYNKIPIYETLGQKIISESSSEGASRVHLDTLEEIKNNDKDFEFVKDRALNFCKQQNLKKELKLVTNIIDNGNFEEYSKIENIIQKALQVGVMGDDATDVFHDIEAALEKDYRLPIATGVAGVDNLLKGGLGRGELGIVLAPTGTGKTTLLTKFANTAYNLDYNVLQIFFEDNVGNIKRKHYTIWTGIEPDEQPENREEVIEKVREAQSRSNGNLKMIKVASDSLTISDIKGKIRKLASEGFKTDLLVLDYVDCISSEKSSNGEEWKGEGSIMRSLEGMTTEFDMAIWTATQGSRDSISSEVVTSDQMGGSIKKAQIAHVILSIAKTLEQKEHDLATLTLLKSRIGKDGVIFQNCKFDNKMLIIDTDSQNTLLGFEEQKVEQRANRAADMYRRRQERTGTQTI